MKFRRNIPVFPISVSVSWQIQNQEQADQLAALMIDMEREARKSSNPKRNRIANGIAKSRRKLQE